MYKLRCHFARNLLWGAKLSVYELQGDLLWYTTSRARKIRGGLVVDRRFHYGGCLLSGLRWNGPPCGLKRVITVVLPGNPIFNPHEPDDINR